MSIQLGDINNAKTLDVSTCNGGQSLLIFCVGQIRDATALLMYLTPDGLTRVRPTIEVDVICMSWGVGH